MANNVNMKIEIGIINRIDMKTVNHHTKIGKITHFFFGFCFGQFWNWKKKFFYSNYYPQQPNRYGDNNRYDQSYRPGAGGAGAVGASGGYDRTDNRQNYQDYRGNGYDNRDPMYYNSMRGGAGGAGASAAGQYGAGSQSGYGNRDAGYDSSYYDGMLKLYLLTMTRSKSFKKIIENSIIASLSLNKPFIDFYLRQQSIDIKNIFSVAEPYKKLNLKKKKHL